MKPVVAILIGAGVLLHSNPSTADCVPAPQLTLSCEGCHGPDGHSHGAIPELSGHTVPALYQRLQELKRGDPKSLLMPRLLHGVDDATLRRIAEHYGCQG